jgi:hypothetical protein
VQLQTCRSARPPNFNGWCAKGWGAYTNAYLVPFKGYGQIPYLEFNGNSNYNSLQASLQRRFSRGLTFGAAYTWSKSMITAAADQDEQNPVNQNVDYRAAPWDSAQVLAANYVYDLPNLTKHFSGPKWLSYVTDNFELSGVDRSYPEHVSGCGHALDRGGSGLQRPKLRQRLDQLEQNINPHSPQLLSFDHCLEFCFGRTGQAESWAVQLWGADYCKFANQRFVLQWAIFRPSALFPLYSARRLPLGLAKHV